MIQKLTPALNATYNLAPGKDTTPKSQREIELEKEPTLHIKAYQEIFNKKK
jgi:hypothetical protein